MLSIVSRANLKSFTLAPATARPTGMPSPSVNMLRLTPRLARSVGLGPVFFPAQRGFRHGSVHRLPGPVEALQLLVLIQAQSPDQQEHSGPGPFLEPAMGRRLLAEARPIQ